MKEIKEMKMGCSFRITVGKLQNQSNPKQPIASHGKMTAVEKVITEILLSMNNPTELARRQTAAEKNRFLAEK